jgi:hypothetical protein
VDDLQHIRLFAMHMHESAFIVKQLDRLTHAPQPIIRIVGCSRRTSRSECKPSAQTQGNVADAVKPRPVNHP